MKNYAEFLRQFIGSKGFVDGIFPCEFDTRTNGQDEILEVGEDYVVIYIDSPNREKRVIPISWFSVIYSNPKKY